MEMKFLKFKKGVIFSLLAVFLSFLFLSFLSLFLSEESHSSQIIFERAKIHKINSELKYFQNVYLRESVTYSAYFVLEEMINQMERDSTYKRDLQNYSFFLDELTLGLLDGEINGGRTSSLSQKNLEFFVNELYKNELNLSHIDFDFEVLDVVAYERKPFFLTLQLNFSVKFGEEGCLGIDLCLWEVNKISVVDVPIYDLKNPLFLGEKCLHKGR